MERLEMPAGAGVSGLESDGGDHSFRGRRQEREGKGRFRATQTRPVTGAVDGSSPRIADQTR